VKPLILGLGNDLFGDDGFGLVAARRASAIVGSDADVVETGAAGLALLDLMVGRPLAVVLDAICTGRGQPGALYRMKVGDLRSVSNLSPHHVGLPEVLRMAQQLEWPIPNEVHIIAVEAEDIITMGRGLTPPVEQALDEAVETTVSLIRQWQGSSEKRSRPEHTRA
jgi:hydrogenase maturation protease